MLTRRARKHLIKKIAVLESRGYSVPIFLDNSINREIMDLSDKFYRMKRHPNKRKDIKEKT